MPTECAAVGCSVKTGPYSFHQFPKDEALKKEWIAKMKKYDPATKKPWLPKKHNALCSKHFERHCFTKRTLLSFYFGLPYQAASKPDAVPTLFAHSSAKRSVEERSAAAKRHKREVCFVFSQFCRWSGGRRKGRVGVTVMIRTVT